MLQRFRTAVILFTVLLFGSGCDHNEDDSDAALFDGTWQIVEVRSATTDFTALVLGRYDEVVVTFVEEEDDFALLLDVSDSPEDFLFTGEFDVDTPDRKVDLRSGQFPETLDFDYRFFSQDEVELTADRTEPVLETLFGIELDVDEIIILMERTSR